MFDISTDENRCSYVGDDEVFLAPKTKFADKSDHWSLKDDAKLENETLEGSQDSSRWNFPTSVDISTPKFFLQSVNYPFTRFISKV